MADARHADKFWSRVNKEGPVVRPELGPCWIWTGDHTHLGYGNFYLERGKEIRASHFALELDGRPVEGRMGLHHCDNPPCVRPSHLFVGTAGDNLRDAIQKGRHHAPPPPKGERHSQAKLTEVQVREILTLSKQGMLQKDIALRYPVNASMISRIVTRKFWSHVDAI